LTENGTRVLRPNKVSSLVRHYSRGKERTSQGPRDIGVVAKRLREYTYMCLLAPLPLLDFFELLLLRRLRSFFAFSCAINSLIRVPLSTDSRFAHHIRGCRRSARVWCCWRCAVVVRIVEDSREKFLVRDNEGRRAHFFAARVGGERCASWPRGVGARW